MLPFRSTQTEARRFATWRECLLTLIGKGAVQVNNDALESFVLQHNPLQNSRNALRLDAAISALHAPGAPLRNGPPIRAMDAWPREQSRQGQIR